MYSRALRNHMNGINRADSVYRCQVCEIESYELLINNISIDVWFGQSLNMWNLRVSKHLNIEKKLFLAMHMTKC